MAARLKAFHQEDVKRKIQASQLVNRIQNHALGETEMTATQLEAAKFLLNKLISNAPTQAEIRTGSLDTVSYDEKMAALDLIQSEINKRKIDGTIKAVH